jgi:two-component system sensor histidine kinase KdpD
MDRYAGDRGRLHLYLAVAPGAGKTCAMLDEGRRLSAEGRDVVLALVETHGRADVERRLTDLVVVPPRQVGYRGTFFPELDVDAVLDRRPGVALVDELAHTNLPGLRRDKRWQDVDDLLAAGIDVVSTLNVQHLASLADDAESATGVAIRETVPDAFAARAERIDFLDVPAAELRARLVPLYGAGIAARALDAWFDADHLGRLRALGRGWLATHGRGNAPPGPAPPGRRIVTALTGEPENDHVVRRRRHWPPRPARTWSASMCAT